MPFLNQSTLDVKLGTTQIHKVMCNGHQVWPTPPPPEWRMLSNGHTHGNYGAWLAANVNPQGFTHDFNPTKYDDPFWEMDTDRGTPFPMFQIVNEKGGKRRLIWGGPWMSDWNSITRPPHYRYSPQPINTAYPIVEVRVGIPHGTGEHGIRIEVDVNPAKMNGGTLSFTGCPLPFSAGRTPTNESQTTSGNTYIYEAKTDVAIEDIEKNFFTSGPGIDKILLPYTAEATDVQLDFWGLSLHHITPAGTSTLFNWPNNFMLIGGRFLNLQQGDDSVHHFFPYTGAASTSHFAENFSADPAVNLGPGNALKCVFNGTPGTNWPTNGGADLFDLAPWNT